MKKLTQTALVLAAGVVLAPVTQARADYMSSMPNSETPGWYVGGGAGATFEQNQKVQDARKDKVEFDPGYNLNVAGGYAWENGFRAEGELYTDSENVEHVRNAGTGPSNGNLSTSIAFLNGLYDIHTGTPFTPYLGAGVGIAYTDVDQIATLSNRAGLNDQHLNLAYQGIAGVAMQLDTNWAVTADYRYIGTTSGKYRETNHQAAYLGDTSNNVVVGVRYTFAEPKPMAPAPMMHTAAPQPMPQPAMKPAVAPVPESYMVFFDWNKSMLTPEAKRILASAAQEYKSGNFIRVVVTGHTDTSGKPGYNQKLSDRRASAVKMELVHLGVAGQSIVTHGVGEDGLLVPTANGVREAQNRRAEIVFDKR